MNELGKKNSEDFQLLPDTPVDVDKQEDIKFGHREVIDSLFKVVEKARPPFTIGLYGKWGSGKTTIAKSVQRLVEVMSQYKTMYFDAWKYEQDSLRRQFLIEMDAQIFDNRLDHKEKLNQSLTKPEPPTLKEIWEINAKSGLVKVAFGLWVLVLVIWIFGTVTNLSETFKQATGLLTSLGLVGVFVQYILSSLQIVYGYTEKHRTDSAEGFEDHFREAFNEYELRDKTLLVVIDNLDRVGDKKAIEILSDIKTFLSKDGEEQNKVVFLIPCDDEALRAHLLNMYGDMFDADEFLRKFFNVTLRIPKFIDIDLYNYTKDLLKETGVKELSNDDQYLVDVITDALRDNPREIKQYINSLIPLILLARERNLQLVINNVPFLAKLLLIRQKFPVFYKLLEERSIWGETSLDDDILLEDYKKELAVQLGVYRLSEHSSDIRIIKEVALLKEFKDRSSINEDYIDIFLTLVQTKEQKDIPEWNSLVLATQSRPGEKEEDQVEKIIVGVKKDKKLDQLDILLRSRVGQLKRGPNITNLVSRILEVSQKLKIDLPKFKLQAARFFPYRDDGDLRDHYDMFNPDLVIDYWCADLNLQERKRIIKPFVNLLGVPGKDKNSSHIDDDYLKQLLDTINKHRDMFSPFNKDLRKNIEANVAVYPYPMSFTSADSRSQLLTMTAAAKFIDSLDPGHKDFEDIENLRETFSFWNNLSIRPASIPNSLKKYREFAKHIQDAGSDEDKLTFANALHEFTVLNNSHIKRRIEEPEVKSEVSELSTILANYYDTLSENNRQKIMVVIDQYILIEGNPQVDTLRDKIHAFIKRAELDEIKKVNKDVLLGWVETYPDIFVARGRTNENFILYADMYTKLNSEPHQDIVLSLISHQVIPERFLEAINYEISNKIVAMDRLVGQIQTFDVKKMDVAIKLLRNLGIVGAPENIVTELKNKLIQFRASHPSDVPKINSLIKRVKKAFTPEGLAELGIE